MSRPTHFNEAAWAQFVASHRVGDVLDGEVVSVVPFGAFIQVGEGVHGLAPKPQWPVLPEPGSRVPVRIQAIDTDACRVALVPA